MPCRINNHYGNFWQGKEKLRSRSLMLSCLYRQEGFGDVRSGQRWEELQKASVKRHSERVAAQMWAWVKVWAVTSCCNAVDNLKCIRTTTALISSQLIAFSKGREKMHPADQLRRWNKGNFSLDFNKCSLEDVLLSCSLINSACSIYHQTLCLEIWIKLKGTSCALGGKFAALCVPSSETLRLSEKDIGFLRGDSFWHSRCWLIHHGTVCAALLGQRHTL